MGAHLIDGEFQSDKYPTTPRGKVPLSVKDPMAQDLLWEYAQRRRAVDAEFSDDLEAALKLAGYVPDSLDDLGIEDEIFILGPDVSVVHGLADEMKLTWASSEEEATPTTDLIIKKPSRPGDEIVVRGRSPLGKKFTARVMESIIGGSSCCGGSAPRQQPSNGHRDRRGKKGKRRR